MLPIFLAAAMSAPSPSSELTFDFRSRAGFFASSNGIPLSLGSFVQYYAPNWSRGYYSTNWNDQTVRASSGGQDVTFQSTDRRVDGRVEFRRVQGGIRADYTLGWTGNEPANVEVSFAHLWAPAFERGRILVDGAPTRSPSTRLPVGNDPKTRMFGGLGQKFAFEAPMGVLEAEVIGAPAYVFDARGYTSDFSRERELFWFGVTDVPTSKDKPAKFSVIWRFTPAFDDSSAATKVTTKPIAIRDAVGPYGAELPLVPKPKEMKPGTGVFRWPGVNGIRLNASAAWPAARNFLRSRFQLQDQVSGDGRISIRMDDGMNLPEGGYELKVVPGSLTVSAKDEEGIRNGLLRAAALTRPDGTGRLEIPATTLRDWPSIQWRGVHMFVGPRANEFQGRMMTNLLAPMMFNQVVLQCERTAWDATKGTEVGLTMSKPDLKRLATNYRAHGIEVTPLIQSFGHMGWLFANGRNRDLAFNKDVLFSVDPRVPRTREVLSAIWGEAVDLLDPKIMHFGLDEVDMRGWPNDPKLVTDLWKMHVPWLGELAKKHGREMMIWGDKMIAPGEAPDAAHGHTKSDAAARRAAVPDGAWVADWHYINNADPKIYTSLAMFEREGLRPVASTWNRPENIKGFFKAAEANGSAVLQTTWAGYESTEENMLRESSQFVAYLLAGEYAWSGRAELAKDLPYSPDRAFQQFMYGGNVPLKPVAGQALSWSAGTTKRIGRFNLSLQTPKPFYSPIDEKGDQWPMQMEFSVPRGGRKNMTLAISVQRPLDELTNLGRVVIRDAAGQTVQFPLQYGRHVRAARETRSPMTTVQVDGIAAVPFDASELTGEISSITIESRNAAAGLKVHAISLH